MEKIGGSVNIRKIAVTGLLSSGKSTVCDILAENGACVVKADDIVHNLLLSDTQVIKQVIETFGLDLLLKNGGIDRKVLAKIVFEDEKKLKKLELLLHPRVIEIIKMTYQTIKDDPNYKAFVVEIPFLFELNFDTWFDCIVTVTTDRALAKKRFIERGFPENQFENRLKRFTSISSSKSDIVLSNNGSLEELKELTKRLL